jgi:hypothetical protein
MLLSSLGGVVRSKMCSGANNYLAYTAFLKEGGRYMSAHLLIFCIYDTVHHKNFIHHLRKDIFEEWFSNCVPLSYLNYHLGGVRRSGNVKKVRL